MLFKSSMSGISFNTQEGEGDEDDYVKQVLDTFSTAKRKYIKYKNAAQTRELKEAA